MSDEFVCNTPEETYHIGERLGAGLGAGDVVLLYGGLGAGKTLLAKGILNALDFDIEEVTSPSFTLVNLYQTPTFDVYHIDLWRLDTAADPAESVGLDDIVETKNAIIIIEWADRLTKAIQGPAIIEVKIEGDGDEPRSITIERREM